MKLFKSLFIVLIISLLSVNTLMADEDFYYVSDYESGLNEVFESYGEANSFYNEYVDEYTNLVLSHNDEVLKMEYGVVSFNSDGCSIDSKYYSLDREEYDQINGCYANDALYLRTRDDYVYFFLSDDMGRISKDEVRLIPFNDEITISSYGVKNNYLYHNIKSQMDKNYYSYSLKLDENVLNFKEGRTYYSYDGHYFYDDFYVMSDDYREDIRTNSLNSDAYYNYYQYLSYRTHTSYKASDFEYYLRDILGFSGRLNSYNDNNNDGANDVVNRSQLYDIADSILASESLYGTNGLLLLSAAINESDYGKSLNSYYHNNLFYTASYNHDYQRETGHFNCVSDSVDNYAHYTINRYLSYYRSENYQGTYFGDKNGGLSVNYSNDPYYGEKNAAIAFDIDEKLGFKDKDRYALAFVSSYSDIFSDYEQEDYIYESLRTGIYPVLNYDEGFYKIQLDSTDSEYYYDFDESTGYVYEDDVLFILNEKDIYSKNETVRVRFDFDGGVYKNCRKLVLNIEDIDAADSITPVKDTYDFIGYEKSYNEEENIWDYKAQYLKIEEVTLDDHLSKNIPVNGYISINDSMLNVLYENGKRNKVAVNSDYLGFYTNDFEEEKEVNIYYSGTIIPVSINFTDEKAELRSLIYESLENQNYQELKSILRDSGEYIGFNKLRKADAYLYEKNHRNYVLKSYDENLDVSISGLDLSLDDLKTWSVVQDIYYVNINEISNNARNIISKSASSYGFKEECGINISFKFNYENIYPETPLLINIKITDKDQNKTYTVYHLKENGDVVKLRSIHGLNSILFEIVEDGDYLVLSKDSFNTYINEDHYENVRKENTGLDEHKINIEFLLIVAIFISNFIGIAIYFILNSRKEDKWRDYKKLLQTQDSVPEEKLKN